MTKFQKGLLAVGGFVVLALAIVFFSYIGYNAQEQRLRVNGKGQEKNCEQILGNSWNMVKEQAQVDKAVAKEFKETVEAVVSGRKGGGSLAKFITESKIEMPIETKKKLMSTIETFRVKFEKEQTKLIALKAEHDALVIHPWKSIFITNRAEMDVTIISSARAKEAYVTGEDNSGNIYGDK